MKEDKIGCWESISIMMGNKYDKKTKLIVRFIILMLLSISQPTVANYAGEE